MASKASAVWTGSLKEGKGTISTATGVLNNANYSFATRFEGADSGTTPEELIAAAHASCFSMALGAQLGGAGLTPEKIETHAAVTLAKTDGASPSPRSRSPPPPSVPGATQGSLRQGRGRRQGAAAPSPSSSPTTPRLRSTPSWFKPPHAGGLAGRGQAAPQGSGSAMESPSRPGVHTLGSVGSAFDTTRRICETQRCCRFSEKPESCPVPKWRNWQTRVVQVHVLARVWGFESLLRHQIFSKSIATR